MRTTISKIGDTTIVTMDGRLDFETAEPLRKNLGRLMANTKTDTVPKKIIFNLENLDFVGSSGISSFIQTLKDFNERSVVKPHYCNVKSEFKRVIKSFDEAELFEIFDNEDRARQSFDQ